MQNADGDGSFWELLGQMKVMQIRQRETLNHQGAITHEVCCLAAQYKSVEKTLPRMHRKRQNELE